MATPTVVRYVKWANPNQGQTTPFTFRLTWKKEDPTIADNGLLLWLFYPSGATLSSIAGTNNTFSTTPVTGGTATDSGNGVKASLHAVYGCAAGDSEIDVAFSASVSGFSAMFVEVANLPSSAGLDIAIGGNPNLTGAGQNIASGSMTTTVDGDLVIQFVGCSDFGAGGSGGAGKQNGCTSFAKQSGYTNLLTDPQAQGHACQYQIQTTHGATNPAYVPTQTTYPSSWVSITAAFKAGSSGGLPAANKQRVFGIQHFVVDGSGGTGNLGYACQCPTVGNGQLLTISDPVNSIKLVSVSGATSGAWNTISSSGGNAQAAYITSSTPSDTEVLTITLNDATAHGYVQGIFYDILNVGTFDSSLHTDSSASFGPGNSPTNNFTPVASAGITFTVAGVATGPPDAVNGPSGASFLSTFYAGETDLSGMDNGDFHAAFDFTSNATQGWIIHNTVASGGGYGMLNIAFAAPATVAWAPSPRQSVLQGWPKLSPRYARYTAALMQPRRGMGSGPQTFSQILSASQASAASLIKQAQLTRSASQATSPTLVKQPQLPRTVTQGTVASFGAKTVGIVRSVTQSASLTLAKAVTHTFATVAQATAATLKKAVSRTLATVSQATSATLVKGVRLIRSVTQATAATLLAQKVKLLTLTATQATTASLAKSVGVVRSITQASTPTLKKAVGATRSIGQTTSAVLVKAVALTRSMTQASVASLVASRLYLRTLTATQATAATLVKQALVTRTVAQASAVTLRKSVGVARTVAQGVSLSITKALALTRSIAQATVATLSTFKPGGLFGGPRYIIRRVRYRPFAIARAIARTFTIRRQPVRAFTLHEPVRPFTIKRPARRAFRISAVSSLRFDTKLPPEAVVLTFDFTPDLLTGETLTGTPTVTISAGTVGTPPDSTPLAANGSAAIDSSNLKVLVPVQAGSDGFDYSVSVTIQTSNTAKKLTLTGTVPVRA